MLFSTALVLVAVALAVNTVRQDRSRLHSMVIVLVVGLFVIFLPPLQLLYRIEWRVQFGTFSATSEPPRVSLCGWYFYPADQNMSLAQVQETEKARQLKVVARSPAGTPILANIQTTVAGSACAGAVYVEATPNHYAVYALSGGP